MKSTEELRKALQGMIDRITISSMPDNVEILAQGIKEHEEMRALLLKCSMFLVLTANEDDAQNEDLLSLLSEVSEATGSVVKVDTG